jgi:hypothetical protein
MGSITFYILKGTTIDFFHLGVIEILFWRPCRGAQRSWRVGFVRKLLSLFTILITAEIMDTFGIDYMHTTLISYMYPAVKVTTKIAKSQKEYQIPINTVFDHLKSFSDKGSRSALDHLQLIEDRCTLFKLAEVSKEEVKRKLLYLSIDDEA